MKLNDPQVVFELLLVEQHCENPETAALISELRSTLRTKILTGHNPGHSRPTN